MKGKKPEVVLGILLLAIASLSAIGYCQPANDTIHVYFGNPDGSPIIAHPGYPLVVDCYIECTPGAYVAGVLMTIGTNDHHISGELTQRFGDIEYPLSEWGRSYFVNGWLGSPPNPTGQHSKTFLGVHLQSSAPYLHFTVPTRCLRFVFQTRDSLSFIGDTVDCLSVGPDSSLTYWGASDTTGMILFPIVTHFSRVCFLPSEDTCDYVIGDINGDGQRMGSDVTYGVRFFRGIGPVPSDSCYNEMIKTPNHYLYVGGDVTGDCLFKGSDITRMVSYSQGISVLVNCPFFPIQH